MSFLQPGQQVLHYHVIEKVGEGGMGRRIHAVLGRVRAQLGDHTRATEAFRQAAAVVHQIADHVGDERLRSIFLSSGAVREALSR